MSTHTPGPWKANFFMVVAPNSPHRGMYGGAQICHTGTHSDILDPHEAEANAQLIAAAPDLLAALTVLSDVASESVEVSDWPELQDALKAAELVIAKAKGGGE